MTGWLGIVGAWGVLAVLGVLNGMLREGVLAPRLGSLALPASGVLLALLLVAGTALTRPWWAGHVHPWQVGAVWLLMTLGFECALGRLRGAQWPEILKAYTFAGGNIWAVDVLVLALAPWLVSP